MTAVKCPECRATFKAVSTSAKLACPKCGVKFFANGTTQRTRVEQPRGDDGAKPARSRRPLIIGVIAAVSVLYLIGGIALAMYFLKGAKKPAEQPVASAEQDKGASLIDTPVNAPATAARDFGAPPVDTRPTDAATPQPEARPAAANPAPLPQAPAAVPNATPVPQPAAAPEATPTPATPPNDGLTDEQRQINKAIDHGVEYLKDPLTKLINGGALDELEMTYRVGMISFAAYTLLECGVPPSDDLLQRAAVTVRTLAPASNRTYSVATSLIFLDRFGNVNDVPLIRQLALRLALAQSQGVLWSYDCPTVTPENEQQAWSCLEAIEKRRTPNITPALLQYPLFRWLNGEKPLFGMGGDHSNTQFAVLALWVGLRHQAPVQRPLVFAAQCFRTTQVVDGSWGYLPKATPIRWKTSMTCSGLLALAIGRSLEPARQIRVEDKKRPPQNVRDLAIEKGFIFLSKSIETLDKNMAANAERGPAGVPVAAPPGFQAPPSQGLTIGADAADDFYFLWSLERVALVYDLKIIGGKDWYQWASRILVRAQKMDGQWADHYKGLPDTCFALLILKRINVVKDLAVSKEITSSLKDVVGSIKENDKK